MSAVISVAARATSSGAAAEQTMSSSHTIPGARLLLQCRRIGDHDRVVLILARSGLTLGRQNATTSCGCPFTRTILPSGSSWPNSRSRTVWPRRTTLRADARSSLVNTAPAATEKRLILQVIRRDSTRARVPVAALGDDCTVPSTCGEMRRMSGLLEISPPCPRPSGSGPTSSRAHASRNTGARLDPNQSYRLARSANRRNAPSSRAERDDPGHCGDRVAIPSVVSALRLCGGGAPARLGRRGRGGGNQRPALNFSECSTLECGGRSDEVSASIGHGLPVAIGRLARVVLVHPKGSVCGERAEGCRPRLRRPRPADGDARLASLRLLADRWCSRSSRAPDRESTTRWNASGST